MTEAIFVSIFKKYRKHDRNHKKVGRIDKNGINIKNINTIIAEGRNKPSINIERQRRINDKNIYNKIELRFTEKLLKKSNKKLSNSFSILSIFDIFFRLW